MPDTLEATPEWSPGQTVKIRDGVTDQVQGKVLPGARYLIEDLWIKLSGSSWTASGNNLAVNNYAIRVLRNDLPWDDDVLYGKIDGAGCLVHISEIEPIDAG